MAHSNLRSRRSAHNVASMRAARRGAPRTIRTPSFFFAGLLLLGTQVRGTAIKEASLASPPTTRPDATQEAQHRKTSSSKAIDHPLQAAGPPDKPCEALIQAVKDAATPLAKAQFALAAARCAVVHSCAGPLSLELNGLPPDRAALASGATIGKQYLNIAAAALGRLPADVDETPRRILQDRIDMLRAFADVFLALAQRAGPSSSPANSDGAQQAAKKLTDACIGLAVFVDDPNPGIAESAKLWQGVAYRRAGRPDRTLNLLLPAIGSLRSSRVDFFIRLERCRALADQGHFIAALSLVMKLEKRVNIWLATEDQRARKRAANSLRALHVKTLKRWAADLRKDGQQDRATAAEAEMQRVLGDHSNAARADELLVLDEAVAGLPVWDDGAKVSTTRPAGSKSAP